MARKKAARKSARKSGRRTSARRSSTRRPAARSTAGDARAATRPASEAQREEKTAAAAAVAATSTDAFTQLVAAHPAIAALKARTILYVHGIGNKPPASVLKCQWDHASFGFDLAERSRLAYWVSREYYPDPEPGTCGTGDLTSLEEAPTGVGLSVRQHQREVTVAEEVDAVAESPSEKALLTALTRRMLEESELAPADLVDDRAALRRGPGAKILPLPRPVREWITRRLVRAFLRDVRDFFYDDTRRAEMRESVLERLRPGGGPFVVVAHSQGSMIAYDVLSSLDATKFHVPLFVTIGSPLGVQEVKDNIRRITGKFAVPACVGTWLNVADRMDPVALDASLDGEYSRRGQINDRRVKNEDSPRHPHSGTGYLRHRDVYPAIRAAVESELFQRVASFTLARDVVRELEDRARAEREPVLIELKDPRGGELQTLAETHDRLIAFLEKTASDGGHDPDMLQIEDLKRYVAARLTREEAERLANTAGFEMLAVSHVWRNSAKHALLIKSAATVQATTAHDGYRALGQDIGWAVLDTGISPHPHFGEDATANVAAEFDCTQRLRRGEVLAAQPARDRHGHGTHVAGVIAGGMTVAGGDGLDVRVTGIAPRARLWVYKVLDDDGYGNDAWIIRALDHIASVNEDAGTLRIHGVNLSLGGPFDPSTFGCGHTPLCQELRRLWRQGVIVVLAAGNEGFAKLQSEEGFIDANMDLSIGDPANLDEAVAVGSVHKENPHTFGVSYFSSRGPTADGRQKPDLVAPGEKILSCRHVFKKREKTLNGLYVEMSGTSMAAPHVSGLLAAFLSARRQFIGYPDWVKTILLESCTDLKRDRPMQGAGLPNLTRMLLNT
jgi:hypothetical protein